MTPRVGIIAGLPVLEFLPGGSGNLEALAFVLGAVIIVIALLLFILVMAGKTPILIFGRFRFEAPLSARTGPSNSPSKRE